MKPTNPGCFYVLCTEEKDWWLTRSGQLQAIGNNLEVGVVLTYNTEEEADAKAPMMSKMIGLQLHPVKVRI